MKNIKRLVLALLGLTIFHTGTIDCKPKSSTSSTNTTTTLKNLTKSCSEMTKSVKSLYKVILTIAALSVTTRTYTDYKAYTKHGNPLALILNGVMLGLIAMSWNKCELGYPFLGN